MSDVESEYFLRSYYELLFPTKLMYQWLSYGNPEFFAKREFSFTLPGDVYIRYQSFNSEEDFLAELKKKKPEKIDIGAVYNQRPKNRNTLEDFIPLHKEFVLDIDLTDYDDVRTCCKEAKVCPKCWKFIAVAVQLLDATLREDFGFEHLLWVFSGRRGVHCWVCDEFAFTMDSSVRSAILEYLTVIRGGENKIKKVTIPNIDRIHPFIQRSIDVIDEHFDEICHEDQNMLENGDKNYEILPDEVKTATRNSSDRFRDVMNYLKENEKEKKTLRTIHQELKLQLCFPRLDVNVSKDLNHLLKSPFCIHPKTGQVCVPFDPERVYEFQPTEVPTVANLVKEVRDKFADQKSESTGEANGGTQIKTSMREVDPFKTALAPHMKIFRDFVRKLEKAREAGKLKNVKHSNANPLEF